MPTEHGLRSAIVAARVGELAGASDAERLDAYYMALLRYVGCTAGSDVAADVMGDEVTVRGSLYGVDWGAPAQLLAAIVRAVGRGEPPLRRAGRVANGLLKLPKLMEGATAHCEVGDRLAARVGFGEGFRAALGQAFERWDGRGVPRKLRGEALALPMRLAQIGEDVEVGHRAGGVEGARTLVRERAGKGLDPRLVERFDARAGQVCAALETTSTWQAFLGAEPGRARTVDDDGAIDEVLRAMGDFADLKSRFTPAHASGVAHLVGEAARRLRLDPATARTLVRAALVHDIGRVAVTAAVWDKPGPLTDMEWERVRMHTYVGERILSRAASLGSIADAATTAHERLDGAGYHRRLPAASCTLPARLLAAADVYRAMTEPRAHRPARGADEAASALAALAREGKLCPDAVDAVLASAGHDARPRPERPAGLTDREVEVLRMVARGLTNKEVAVALSMSTKTAGNHLQHIYEKIGVTTRSAATLFAMQKGLLG